MYHSITFGDKNTWDDWHLIPSSRPVFNPPSVKTRYLEIPGADGSIDLTESLTGYPVYGNREGSFEFLVMDQDRPWSSIYSEIMAYLHGRKMDSILEDDPAFCYTGRFAVNAWNSNKDYSTIAIDYSVGPYKRALTSTLKPWLWDPFSFVDGIIASGLVADIEVLQNGTVLEVGPSLSGNAPIPVEFVAGEDSGVSIVISRKTDGSVQIPAGSKRSIPELLLYRGVWLYGGKPSQVTAYPPQDISETTVSIDFRPGKL